jgi:hypothetical protein
MIIVNLKGGTGNQLFQYALGRRLALQNDDELLLDVDGLDRANAVGDIYRPFALSAFSLAATPATAEEVRRLKYPYGLLSKAWRFVSFKLLRRHHVTFEPNVLRWSGDIYLDGFWQSPRYFENIRETLLADLTLHKPLEGRAAAYAAQIASCTAVALHIRRGDYAKNPHVASALGLCSLSYYEKAVAHIKAHVEQPTFFIFSDDMAWVKANLPVGKDAVFVEGDGLADTTELILMSKCQHNIIANSSFSWWGAWLNQNPNKIVVAPTPWFDQTAYDKDLIPPSWVQLSK